MIKVQYNTIYNIIFSLKNNCFQKDQLNDKDYSY